MSKQWGHGYMSGVEKSIKSKPKHVLLVHVWRWGLRNCWWSNIWKPVRLDFAWPHSISITAFGFTLIIH